MSSTYTITCPSCGSYQHENVPCSKLTWKQTFRYECLACGERFDVSDFAEYVKKHPPDPRRCFKCDKVGVELIERNHQYDRQPKGEIVDLYRCSHCGQETFRLVQESPQVLYG